MKKAINYLFILIAISLCGLTVYGLVWVRQYQSLTEDEVEITLHPDLADVTYCTFDGVPLSLDLYFPSDEQAPWQVLVYVRSGSFTAGDKRKGSGIIDIPAMTERGFAVAAINYRLMPKTASR